LVNVVNWRKLLKGVMDRSSVLFLILFMANAFRGRFLALFYEAHNLNDAQIGYILSVSSLVSLACSPLASKIADKYDSRALVTMVTYSFGIAVFLMQLIALPDIHVGLSQKGRFATLFVMRVFQAGFASPVYPLVCAMCIAALRKEFGPDGHTKFGQKRLWGAVGWAFSSLLLGFLLDQDGIGVWIVHVGYSVFGCLFLAVVYLSSGDERKRKVKRTSSWELIFPDHVEAGSDKAVEGGISATAVAKDINQQQQEISYVAVLHNLFSGDSIPEDSTMSVSAGMQSRARIMMFLVIQFTLAAVMSLVENLLFLFFKDDLHASYTVCGLSVVVTVIFEIPLFAFAPKLLKQIGAVNLLTIATMSFAVRAIGYTYSPNGYWVLLWEPLHGVTYACADTASVAFFAERMPKVRPSSAEQRVSSSSGRLPTSRVFRSWRRPVKHCWER